MKNSKTEKFIQPYLKADLPDIRPGQQVRVTQRLKDGDKERIHSFEGQVLARKHGREIGATITIRRLITGIGTEIVLPLHSPLTEKIEILRQSKVRRAKLYYLRETKGKRGKLKEKVAKPPIK